MGTQFMEIQLWMAVLWCLLAVSTLLYSPAGCWSCIFLLVLDTHLLELIKMLRKLLVTNKSLFISSLYWWCL